MVQTTRGQIISSKYCELVNQLKQYIDTDIFPSLEDTELSDIIFYFNLYFPPKSDYKNCLMNVLELGDIKLSDDDFNKVYIIVLDYINWFQNLSL
jgi:hypothetical protein